MYYAENEYFFSLKLIEEKMLGKARDGCAS